MNNNNENLTEENENSSEKEVYNKIPKIYNNDISKSMGLPKIFNKVTRSDLLLFKEDFLQNLKEIKTELNTIISERFEKCNKLIEESNQKLYNYEIDKNGFIQKLNFLEEKNEILSTINQTTIDIKNDLNLHMLQIQNCQKDISNMGFKYDKIITSNLMIPGIVGPMCKFNNLKEYLLNDKELFSNINSEILTIEEELRQNKKKIDELRDTVKVFNQTLEPTFQSLVELKVRQFEIKINEKLENFSERLGSMRIQNLASVKSFLEKEKDLDEYLLKMENIKKEILKDNEKTFDKTKKLNKYTLLKLEKSLSESNNVRKSVLELANIFTKQKRIYGDDNLNENKRQVIINFSSAMSNLIKDLINNKSNIILDKLSLQNNNILNENNLDLDYDFKEDFIKNQNIRKNGSRKSSVKLTEKSKNLYSKKFYNFANENNSKELVKPKKRNSIVFRSINNNIYNNNNEERNYNNYFNKYIKKNINDNVNREKLQENIDISLNKNNIIESDDNSSSERINFNNDIKINNNYNNDIKINNNNNDNKINNDNNIQNDNKININDDNKINIDKNIQTDNNIINIKKDNINIKIENIQNFENNNFDSENIKDMGNNTYNNINNNNNKIKEKNENKDDNNIINKDKDKDKNENNSIYKINNNINNENNNDNNKKINNISLFKCLKHIILSILKIKIVISEIIYLRIRKILPKTMTQKII